MKAASSCARARKLLASVAAALAATLTFSMSPAHADDPPDSGYPKIGTSSESVPGYRLNVKKIEDGKPQPNHVTPHLFTVHTEKGVIKAYCIEIEIDVIYGSSLRIGGWKDFPGTNKFKDNPDVQAKVAWIAQRSYPQTNLAEVTKASGVQGLTEKDAITATQAAIWHFTNNFQYTGTVSGIDQASATRVQKLYEYLISEKNVGLKETARPTVEFKGATGTSIVTGDKVGPLRFESNQTTVKVTNKLDYELVDANSKKVDLNAVPSGTDLYLKVPAGVTSGEQKFEVSATGSVYAGKLLISKGATPDKHSQTIIIGSNKEVTVEASAVLKWNAVPKATTPAPTPTPTPSNSTPAPKPSKSEPSTPKPGTPKKPGLPRTGTI